MKLSSDLKRALSGVINKRKKTEIALFVGTSRLEKLVEVFVQGPYRVTQNAAWVLGTVAERHPEAIAKHLNRLLREAAKPGASHAVRRNVVRIMQFVPLPRRLHGNIIDLCSRFLHDRREPVATRVFSMTVLANLSSIYPDTAQEVLMIIEREYECGSPAFASRARRVRKMLVGQAHGHYGHGMTA